MRKILFITIISLLHIQLINAFYKEHSNKEFSEIYKDDPTKHSNIDNYSDYIIQDEYQQADLDDNWWENPIIVGEGDGGFVGESDEENVPINDSLWIILILGYIYGIYRKIIVAK